ncbi:MAG: antitoxin [Gammaproteobacteria bacterium]|nr:antitoxin [Gammaproteobacteria bacterium]
MQTGHDASKKRKARLFRNGRNQAVRLPVEFEINADEVYVRREGDEIVLTPRPRSWDNYFEHGKRLAEDFPDEIEDVAPQQRESI